MMAAPRAPPRRPAQGLTRDKAGERRVSRSKRPESKGVDCAEASDLDAAGARRLHRVGGALRRQPSPGDLDSRSVPSRRTAVFRRTPSLCRTHRRVDTRRHPGWHGHLVRSGPLAQNCWPQGAGRDALASGGRSPYPRTRRLRRRASPPSASTARARDEAKSARPMRADRFFVDLA